MRASRRDEAAVWLFAARLQSVTILNRAIPRAETIGRAVKRHVWLERRPALATPAALVRIEVPAVIPSVPATAFPLAA